MLFKELVEIYFRNYAPYRLKPITMYNYKHQIDYHLMAYWGDVEIQKITPPLISEFFVKHKSTLHGKYTTMSHSNARKVYNVMKSLFHYAVTSEHLESTPCHDVILPVDENAAEKIMYLHQNALDNFLHLFKDDNVLYCIVCILLHTGMRCGECLGLMWSDIDFKNDCIHIRRNLSKVENCYYLTSPKSRSGIRCVYMNGTLKSILTDHQLYQAQLVSRLGGDICQRNMVFTSSTGNYKDRNSVYNAFKRRICNTPYSYMTLHKLRHTNATLLLNNGVDIKIISEHLGHSSIGVTANIYADVTEATKKKTAELLGNLIPS